MISRDRKNPNYCLTPKNPYLSLLLAAKTTHLDMSSLALSRIAWQLALSATFAALVVFIFKLVKMRMIFYKLKKQGLVRNPPRKRAMTCREC